MADLAFSATTPSGGVSVASDAALHTVLQLVAPANQRVRVRGFVVGFKGTVTTDTPIQVRLLRQTSAGTSGGAVAPINLDSKAEAIQTTAARGVYTVEPTASNVLWESTSHPQWQVGQYFPLSEEIIMGGGTRLGIDCLIAAGAANTAYVTIFCEE